MIRKSILAPLGAPLMVAAVCVTALVSFDHLPRASAQAQVEPAAAAQVDAGTAAAPTRLPDMPIIAPPDIDPVTTASKAFGEFKSGRYFGGVCLIVILVVWGLRRSGLALFQGDRAGAVLALLVGQATAFGSVAIGGALSPGVILDTIVAGLVLTVAGAGTRTVAKRLAVPPDQARD